MSAFDLLEACALDPTPEGLHALQSAILREPSHDPMLMVSGTLVPLTREDRAQEVVDTIRSWMPGALLSPSAHGYLARALSRLGDEEGSRTETTISRLALESLAATGGGVVRTRARCSASRTRRGPEPREHRQHDPDLLLCMNAAVRVCLHASVHDRPFDTVR